MSKKSLSLGSENKKKSKTLSLPELSLIDDVCKILLIDPHVGFEVKKMNLINIDFLKCENDSSLEILEKFMAHHDNVVTIRKLKEFLILEKIPKDFSFLMQDLQHHLNVYLNLLNPSSGFLVIETERYTSKDYKQVKIIANMDLNKGTKLECLRGPCIKLDTKDETVLESCLKDFSIVYSKRLKRSLLMLGPVSFVNHDCDSNCYYTINEKNEMFLITKRSIQKGDEITTYYDDNYFDLNNINCECCSCEKNGLGIYKKNFNKSDKEECIFIPEESEEVRCNIYFKIGIDLIQLKIYLGLPGKTTSSHFDI